MSKNAFERFLAKKGPERSSQALFRFITEQIEEVRREYAHLMLTIVAALMAGPDRDLTARIYFDAAGQIKRTINEYKPIMMPEELVKDA